MDVAVALLARRDYGREQLKSRLLDKGFELPEVEQTLDGLEAKGFIDDQRFAAALLRSHIAKAHGPGKVRQALMQKGLNKQCIEQVLDASDCDWFALARTRALKKFGDSPADDMKEKARRIRHLMGQGFSYDQVGYALEYDPYD